MRTHRMACAAAIASVVAMIAAGARQAEAAERPTSVGSEFQINSTTRHNQWHPAVAPLPDGGFVAVFNSFAQRKILGQRYDGSGARLGGEFAIGDAGTFGAPSIASSPEGKFVVVWPVASAVRGSQGEAMELNEVDARVYSSNGTPLVGPFRVNEYTEGDQSAPAVAMSSDGGFVVTWQSEDQDGSGFGVFARRYDAAGASLGPEFQVNTQTAGEQWLPAIAAHHPGGGFTVVWASEDEDGGGFGVYGRRFDAEGIPEPTGEFRINTYTMDDQTHPAIAVDPQGRQLVVWQSRGQDGDDFGIYGQRYDASGATDGPEFSVNTTRSGIQQRPSAAFGPNGDSFVAWETYVQPGDLSGNLKDVFAQYYGANGSSVGAEIRINTAVANYQDDPAVAGNSDGSFVIAWESNSQDGNSYGIFGQRYATTLEPVPAPTPATAILVQNDALSLRPTALGDWCGTCAFCDCGSSCAWAGGDGAGEELRDKSDFDQIYLPLFPWAPPSRQQLWGVTSNAIRSQSGFGVDPLPLRPAVPGEPFPLLHFSSMNWPTAASFPTSLRIAASLIVRPPGGDEFEIPMCGIPLTFIETQNLELQQCDPSIQRSNVPCDDAFTMQAESFEAQAPNGDLWTLKVIGWDDPWSPGTIAKLFVGEERTETGSDMMAVLTVKTATPPPAPTFTPTPEPTPTPIILSVVVTGSQSYGSASPIFTTSTAPPPDNTFTGTLTCTSAGQPIDAALPAGSYTIDGSSCSGLALSGPTAGDYTIVYSGSTFTVSPAPLTVNAPSATANFGAVPATFAPTYTGLQNGQTAPATPATCTSNATNTSHPGTYAITCSGAADANYAISYGPPGTLTIAKAPTTVTAAPAKKKLLSITMSATLKRADNAAPIAGERLTFSVANVQICQATTNSSGVASCSAGVAIVIGRSSYSVTFAGDVDYVAASGNGSL